MRINGKDDADEYINYFILTKETLRIMTKKTLIFSLILAWFCVLPGCSRKSNKQIGKEIETFVNDTYTDVFSAYTEENQRGGMGPDRSVFDKKYLTRRLQREINNDDMIDCDYWLQAQDFTTPVFKIKESHATDDSNGYVDIIIKVFGAEDKNAVKCRVVVTKEKGKWKIDNFKYMGEYDSQGSF